MDNKKGPRVVHRAVSFGPDEHLSTTEREAREDAEMKLESGNTSQISLTDDPDWKPGFANRFPWLGLGSLGIVVLCAIASVLVLTFANGKSESQWKKQIAPNVIITVINSFANLCFGIAISNGIAIAWWRKTLQGATIEHLNRSWLFSSSLKEVLLGAKYFNFIALAALTAKLTIIDGTLLQKSFSTEIQADKVAMLNMTGYANRTIPMTGRITGDSTETGLLAKNWNDDLKIWSQGGGRLPNTYEGCDGLCYLQVPGAGFEFDCTEPTELDINYGNTLRDAVAFGLSSDCLFDNGTLVNNTACEAARANTMVELFHTHFEAVYDNGLSGIPTDYSYINLNITYTNATDDDEEQGNGSCPGKRYTQYCKLRPAVINYPVKIEAYKDQHSITSMSLALDNRTQNTDSFTSYNYTLKQQNGFEVVEYNDVHEDFSSGDTRTRLGGVAKGFDIYLGGNATMAWNAAAASFNLNQDGNAPMYLFNDLDTQEGKRESKQRCGFQFVNPMLPQIFEESAAKYDPQHQYDMPSLVGKINQMMFALALDISNEDDDKDYVAGSLTRPGKIYRDTIHYKINTNYMWGAFASIMFCIACVLPTYWGYWQLGRSVTLGPFEIAAAFRAPNLHHPTNKPIDQLIKEVGGRQVKLGAIVAGADAGKIGVAEPEAVSRIHPSASPHLPQRFSTFRQSMRSNRQARPSSLHSDSRPNTATQ